MSQDQTQQTTPVHARTGQVHEQFAAFSHIDFGSLAAQVTAFVRDSKIAPKSIAVTEVGGRLIASLGYRDDQTTHPVTLKSVNLGDNSAATLAEHAEQLEEAITEAVANQDHEVLCHALYAPDNKTVALVLLCAV